MRRGKRERTRRVPASLRLALRVERSHLRVTVHSCGCELKQIFQTRCRTTSPTLTTSDPWVGLLLYPVSLGLAEWGYRKRTVLEKSLKTTGRGPNLRIVLFVRLFRVRLGCGWGEVVPSEVGVRGGHRPKAHVLKVRYWKPIIQETYKYVTITALWTRGARVWSD